MQSLIPVNLPQNSYQIAIAPGSLQQLGEKMKPLDLGRKVLLVSNPAIFEYYGATAVDSLTAAGFQVSTHLIPDGESYKTLEQVSKVYHTAAANYLERSSTLVALGGGVIGDMTGFAAATWLRGINFVQVPTSLLAMVDASIGGKTGVNHPQGKNLIGAFHQPKLVLIDPLLLATLPEREFCSGMAEVIKYGIIWDEDLFLQLEEAERTDTFFSLKEELLQTILTRSCQAKADVVSKDEKEAGLRAILNYGHTVGHGVESVTGYGKVLHGEGVAMGMVVAGHIAEELQLWTALEVKRQQELIAKTGLPTKLPSSLDLDAIVESLKSDKKVKGGKIRFVLPKAIGQVTITDEVSSQLIRQALEDNLVTADFDSAQSNDEHR